MPRIYVDFAKLDQIGNRCKSVASKVDTIQSDLQHTIRQLDWDVRFESNINSTATQIARKLEQYSKALENYQRFIEDAKNEYVRLDKYPIDRMCLQSLGKKYETRKDAYGTAVMCSATRIKGAIGYVEKSYQERGGIYVAHQYGKCALKVASAAVKIFGSLAAFSSGVGIPIALCEMISAGNDIQNALTDGYYTYTHQYDKIGTTNVLKDTLVNGYGYIGELLGYPETGEVVGEVVYTGLDVISLLDGMDKMLKSLGKVNTVVTNTTGYSKVWGETHFDDILNNELKFDLKPDYFIRKILDVDPSSDANIIYEGAKNVYSTIKSAWGLGDTLSSIG